jgi:hypothetical protein
MRLAIISFSRRVYCLAAFLALTLLLVSSSGAVAQQAEIGIYNDENRSSCSLSDAGSGLITAYVVVNSSDGVTGVRFSIPKPDCFNAVWVGESSDYVTIGNSQSDISIATGTCVQGPTHLLTIMYQKTSPTATCCEMQVNAAQGQSGIQFTDCIFVEHPLAPKSAFINGNETCACTPGLNLPPSVPRNPTPAPGLNNVPTDVVLGWEASDPEQSGLHYDLYLGTSSDPPLVASYLTAPSYSPQSLAGRTLYYWKVVAFDSDNLSTAGPVWTFTTGACSQASVVLRSAGVLAVLAGSTVTSTGATSVTGDLGVSPGTAVTGFPPGNLVGAQHAGDPAGAQALGDLTTAYNDAAGRTLCPMTVAGNLGGQTLVPGLYKSTSSLEVTSGDLTLDAQGDADAVFIFQIASTLTTTSGRRVILSGGAKATNVFWQVGSSATLGTGSVFQGTIMADQAITMGTGATLSGRVLARIAGISLDGNTIVMPAP